MRGFIGFWGVFDENHAGSAVEAVFRRRADGRIPATTVGAKVVGKLGGKAVQKLRLIP